MQLTAYRPSIELVALVAQLGGQWSGYRALCRCPAHADRSPSLSIRQGDRGVLVHCFAGCNPVDVLRALRRVSLSPVASAPDITDTDERAVANVERIWREGRDVDGTLAKTYLKHRRIDTAFRDLRYHPRCPKGRKPETVFMPAMLVAVRDDARLTAIQRIFLEPNGHYTEKLMIGRPGAGAWRGSHPINGKLAIAEGFETAARFTERTGIACWAALGDARLPMLALPTELTELVIAEDSDPQGRLAAARAWRAHSRPGLTVKRMPPPATPGRPAPNDWAEIS